MNASDPINIICQILQGGGRPHMAHHDNWTPQMGTWVVINAGWYYMAIGGAGSQSHCAVTPDPDSA